MSNAPAIADPSATSVSTNWNRRYALDAAGVLIGRNRRDKGWTAGLQLLLACAALLVLPILILALGRAISPITNALYPIGAGHDYHSLDEVIRTWRRFFLLIVPMLAILSYFVFRLTQKRAGIAGFRAFCRAFYRATLMAFPLYFVLYLVLDAVLSHVHAYPGEYTAETYIVWIGALIVPLVLAPALFFEKRLKRGLLQSTWRPVCPECGHSVRGAVSDRCTECGEVFPAIDRPGYRWGALRLPWERRGANMFLRYGPTEFLVLFRPFRAGARCAVPGRFVRVWLFLIPAIAVVIATRAAAVGIPAIIMKWKQPRTTATLSTKQFLEALWNDVYQFLTNGWLDELSRVWLPWLMLLLAFPLVGIFLVWLFPIVGSAAARRTRMKWSVYAALAPIALAVAYVLMPIMHSTYASPNVIFRGMPDAPWRSDRIWQVLQTFVPILLATCYGAYWAAGLSRNPFNHYRGFGIFALLLMIYVSAWWLIETVLFPPGVLVTLL
ncbi:MAG: hypothetical protein AB7N71_02420 [Phycisphaerae bacterium]